MDVEQYALVFEVILTFFWLEHHQNTMNPSTDLDKVANEFVGTHISCSVSILISSFQVAALYDELNQTVCMPVLRRIVGCSIAETVHVIDIRLVLEQQPEYLEMPTNCCTYQGRLHELVEGIDNLPVSEYYLPNFLVFVLQNSFEDLLAHDVGSSAE